MMSSILNRYRFAPHSHEENVLAVTTTAALFMRREPWTDEWAVALGYVSVPPFKAFPDLLTVAPVNSLRANKELSLLSAREMAGA